MPSSKKQPKKAAKETLDQAKGRFLPRLAMVLFDRPKTVLLAWLVLVVFGAFSYSTLLRREGFPNIDIPVAVISGSYAVNDAAQVDELVAKPLAERALQAEGVSVVQTTSGDNFFNVAIQYSDDVDASAAADSLRSSVESESLLPANVQVRYDVPYFGVTGGDIEQVDAVLSLYARDNNQDVAQLAEQGKAVAAYLNEHKPQSVEGFKLVNPLQEVTDPRTGQTAVIQKTFDRYGERNNNQTRYYNAVSINVAGVEDFDVIGLDDELHRLVDEVNAQPQFADYEAAVSASFAPEVKGEISELQRVLIEGLIAVLVVGSIVIALRASFITVISMITVITITLGVLYMIDYTLNVITLFALILGLSLIVDDTIIMIEAIDASRRRHKRARDAVAYATRKISRAMVAATATAVLSFAPLLFTSGILGTFIRAIPVTIILSLLISLVVALVFIPLFARYVLLGKKQMGEGGVRELAAGVEAKIARFICKPMLWARGSYKKLTGVGLSAVFIGIAFVAMAGFIFQYVSFNIFPPTKDTNGLTMQLEYPNGTSVERAGEIADQANAIVSEELGDNFVDATYYGKGGAAGADSVIDIISYSKRDVSSQDLVQRLQERFDNDFTAANVVIGQTDTGPPPSAFTVQLKTRDREAGYRLANDIVAFLQDAELKRPDESTARFVNPTASNPGVYTRSGADLVIGVSASFDGDDTTTLVTLAQNAVRDRFTPEVISSYGLPEDVIDFDLGQESENQESFKSLVFAFPILLAVMFLLLAVEFRSLLQPLLIFLAVPFSLFGVTLGLYLTDNAFSFFVAMGFFALVGLSVKNTILLTDYANQARAEGMGAIDSVVEALQERFRPLIATSLTAVVSLIPLAIISPFWQPLAVVLIFGLLSSTLLVLTVFPYYLLGGEFLRRRISRVAAVGWVLAMAGLVYLSVVVGQPLLAVFSPLLAVFAVWAVSRTVRRGAYGGRQ
ncbi:hypothetical protein CR970_00800 [Candidatus Saccharibacteria bacterium]|nr:MAG: hypothetical protein CR970_00800 [Candidatus Saccharibacteria bacterium]